MRRYLGYTLLSILILFAYITLSVSTTPAEALSKVIPHDQPFDASHAASIEDYAGFDHPDYYYAAVQTPPTGTTYRSVGLSPDGAQLIAQKSWNDGAYDRTEIVLLDADGSNEVVISPGDSGEGDIYGYSAPFWSDDGTAIGFLETHRSNPNKVMRYDISTGTRTYLYEPSAPDDVANCDFLGASKTEIVFWAYGAGGPAADLFIWDGANRTNITNSADYKEYEPVSNEDGTVILYWSGETATEPVNTTHTLTNVGGTWTKDVGFTPIPDSYWAFWSGQADHQIGLTVFSTKDIAVYDNTGAFVLDLTGPGYSGGGGQWNFYGFAGQGANGEIVMTSNAARTTTGRDIVFAAPRDTLFVDDDGSDDNPGTAAAPFATIQKAVDEAAAGGVIHVAAGSYVETVTIDKAVTLRGATHAANKNGYTVPTGYTWDDTIESIIQVNGDETIVTITADDVILEGFVIQALNRSSSGARHLVEVQADGHGKDLENIVIKNNVIGPNTNTVSQDGTKGRMNLYIAINQYQATPWGLINSTISGNKIFGSEGNGDAVFIWGGYYAYGARHPSPMTGTVIEDNEISAGHRAGIEVAGGVSELVIRDNDIHDFSSIPADGSNAGLLKYGGGILMIRGSSDKTDCNGLGPVDITITGNDIYNCEKNAIYMGPNNQGIVITDNELHDNGSDGVRVDLIGNYWNPDFDPNPGPYTCLGGSSAVTAFENQIQDNGAGAQVIGAPSNGFTLDARYNWWGDDSGPGNQGPGSGDGVSANVNYSPWLGNWPDTPSSNTFYADDTGDAADFNDCIANYMTAGDTLVFEEAAFPGGIVVGVDGVTLDLNRATFGPGSPAFTITADDVTILGPGVIDGDPTDSGTNSTDPGILVQAGADNFILQNVEVKRWADGARVDGNVTSLKIVGSWFHSNTDAGLEVNGDIAGITTIEGNLFKVNGGNGVTYAGAGLLKAEYNAWGDLGGPNAGSGDGVDPGTVDFEPFTFAEFFIDVDPDLEATEREVPEGTDFDVELKADTANLFGLTFKIVYDTSWLTLNSTIFSAPWVNRCAAIPPTTAGEIYYYCNLRAGDGEWTVDGDTVATLNFTTAAGTTGENGPWETTLDISHAILDTSAGARNGAKIYVNNAGFNDPSASERDITDTDDGKITILGQAQYTGYVDLQGRANDSGALVSVFDSNARSTAVLLADATSASSGTYTTAYVGATPLTIGSTYWLLVDRALYLPTTLASADYGDSKLLDTRPLTLLATLILLGGDATNDDTIDIYDLSCIGGDYGMTSGFTECGGAGSGGSSDVNGDSLINIQDLSLSGGNWYLSESPWTP